MFVTSDFNTFNDLHVLNIYHYNKVALRFPMNK